MNLSDLKNLFSVAQDMGQYRELKGCVARLSQAGQLLMVDAMIDCRARLEGLWAKTAPTLETRTYREAA